MDKNDGGPAFPRSLASIHGDYKSMSQASSHGMTLRDYFAAAALGGWFGQDSAGNPEIVAATCYEFADAMIAVRGK